MTSWPHEVGWDNGDSVHSNHRDKVVDKKQVFYVCFGLGIQKKIIYTVFWIESLGKSLHEESSVEAV